jgi:hypothetical protein
MACIWPSLSYECKISEVGRVASEVARVMAEFRSRAGRGVQAKADRRRGTIMDVFFRHVRASPLFLARSLPRCLALSFTLSRSLSRSLSLSLSLSSTLSPSLSDCRRITIKPKAPRQRHIHHTPIPQPPPPTRGATPIDAVRAQEAGGGEACSEAVGRGSENGMDQVLLGGLRACNQKTGRRLVATQKTNDGEARSEAVGRGSQDGIQQVWPSRGGSSACGGRHHFFWRQAFSLRSGG